MYIKVKNNSKIWKIGVKQCETKKKNEKKNHSKMERTAQSMKFMVAQKMRNWSTDIEHLKKTKTNVIGRWNLISTRVVC